MTATNIFADLPAHLHEELFTVLAEAAGVRVERIVSPGRASPDGLWLDDPQHEWVVVLRGAARLRFEGEERAIEMSAGDFVNIPAHKRHRVEWTTPDGPTVWLAVHYGGGPRPAGNTRTLFVYGSLKAGKSNNHYLTRDGGQFLRAARTAPKYRLVRQWFANYPTMLERENGVPVEGELWSVNDAVIDTLDFVEGVGRGLFKRVPILLDTGETAEGYVAASPPYPYRSIGTRWE